MLRNTLWHMLAGKKCRFVSVGGLAPKPPQTTPMRSGVVYARDERV